MREPHLHRLTARLFDDRLHEPVRQPGCRVVQARGGSRVEREAQLWQTGSDALGRQVRQRGGQPCGGAGTQQPDGTAQGHQRVLDRVAGEHRVGPTHGRVGGVAGDDQHLQDAVVQAVGEGVGIGIGQAQERRRQVVGAGSRPGPGRAGLEQAVHPRSPPALAAEQRRPRRSRAVHRQTCAPT